jgi:hypothetical protein
MSLLDIVNASFVNIQELARIYGNTLGGMVMLFLVLITVRLVFHSYLVSTVGRSMANLYSGMVEIFIALLAVVCVTSNPGVVITTIGWTTFVFHALLSEAV